MKNLILRQHYYRVQEANCHEAHFLKELQLLLQNHTFQLETRERGPNMIGPHFQLRRRKPAKQRTVSN